MHLLQRPPLLAGLAGLRPQPASQLFGEGIAPAPPPGRRELRLDRYFLIVLRDLPGRRAISRRGNSSRKAMGRMMFKSPICITPMSPAAHAAGGRVTWVNSQWKLRRCPGHIRVEIKLGRPKSPCHPAGPCGGLQRRRSRPVGRRTARPPALVAACLAGVAVGFGGASPRPVPAPVVVAVLVDDDDVPQAVIDDCGADRVAVRFVADVAVPDDRTLQVWTLPSAKMGHTAWRSGRRAGHDPDLPRSAGPGRRAA